VLYPASCEQSGLATASSSSERDADAAAAAASCVTAMRLSSGAARRVLDAHHGSGV